MTWRSRHLAWRRNWWLIMALAGFSVGLLVLVGSDAVVPYTSSRVLAKQTRRDGVAKRDVIDRARGVSGENIEGTVDLFDDSVVHRVSIEISPREYDAMIAGYQTTGEKSWHPARVVIDGTPVDRVGVRLKGNSTLIGLRYSGSDSPAPPGILAALGQLSPDEPHKIPFLLRFDQYVPEQRYQHVNELALRTAGGFGGDVTQTTELVANRLLEEEHEPFLRSAPTGVSVNGSPESLDLMVEHPDDFWAQRMLPDSDAEPALYKAIVAARFRYVGDDPALYVKVFNQQAESRSIGPKPMIDFLKFVERSSDSDFEARLADHLDVAGFASYLAYQNLLVDPDSFAGTGNNYYFLYDADRGRLEIAAWDQNLALGRLGLVSATYRPYYEDGSGIPTGLQNLPGFEELIQGEGGGEPNLLATRFLGSPKFRAMYDRAYRGLYERLFTSGRIEELINRYVEVLRPANLERGFVDPERFEADVQRDLTFVAERRAYLSGVPPIAG